MSDVNVLGEIVRRLELELGRFASELERRLPALGRPELREPREVFASLLGPLNRAGRLCGELGHEGGLTRDVRLDAEAMPLAFGDGGARAEEGHARGTLNGHGRRANGAGSGAGEPRRAVPPDDPSDDPIAILLHLDERLQRLLAGLNLALVMIGEEAPDELLGSLEALRVAARLARRRLDAFEPSWAPP